MGFFCFYEFLGIFKRGPYIRVYNAIFLTYLVGRGTACKAPDDPVYRNPGSPHHRLAMTDRGIDCDPFIHPDLHVYAIAEPPERAMAGTYRCVWTATRTLILNARGDAGAPFAPADAVRPVAAADTVARTFAGRGFAALSQHNLYIHPPTLIIPRAGPLTRGSDNDSHKANQSIARCRVLHGVHGRIPGPGRG